MRGRLFAVAGAYLAATFPSPGRAEPSEPGRPFAAIVQRETAAAKLPVDIADAVMAIESSYDPTRIGGVGEIGLMQVLPGTARMLGFDGSLADLAKPDVNIHYGVLYLAGAWRQANGDLCRALMKYRAGHGQEAMTPRSVSYCQRAKAHLADHGSLYAGAIVPAASASAPAMNPSRTLAETAEPEAGLKGAAFWAVHNARIRAISASFERRWRRMASR